MKILSHKVLVDNLRYKIFELRVRFGLLFYTYKTIKVTFLFSLNSFPDVEGLTTVPHTLNYYKIWDYCSNVYGK